jgi:uncharacterized protein (DUF39 family)
LNRVHPGQFKYGGGHVIHDLVAGKKISLKATAYGTDCYPNREAEKKVTLAELPYAMLFNPRNGYQNYNCALNLSAKTIYTYMGVLKPNAGNANYATSGQLSPLLNDPFYRTMGLGTRIFLGGAQGYIIGPGTQHNPNAPRGENGVPLSPAGTLMVMGNLKEMHPLWDWASPSLSWTRKWPGSRAFRMKRSSPKLSIMEMTIPRARPKAWDASAMAN